MKFDAMILHSCHIQINNQAILFTAPSGTGKSTQGNLWHTYRNAKIINGDRTIIRKRDDTWYAYGAPFCGTSNISLNKEAPIKAIVVLRQSPQNHVERIYGQELFSALYSELTINNWNDKFVEKALNWITEISKDINIYRFLCTKNLDAVEALENILYPKQIIYST